MDVGDQADSDPLPYTQVDRSAKPKAALLAGLAGVPFQHALGGLVLFWDICGDPRVLERIILQTPPGQEPAVILSTAELEERFKTSLAIQQPVSATILHTLGIVESRTDGHRVRGMSRFFAPVKARLARRVHAQAAGKASAAARKSRHGTAQPQKPALPPGSNGVRAGFEPTHRPTSNKRRTTPERPPNGVRTPAEPASNTTVNGHLTVLQPPIVPLPGGRLNSRRRRNRNLDPLLEPPDKPARCTWYDSATGTTPCLKSSEQLVGGRTWLCLEHSEAVYAEVAKRPGAYQAAK